MEENAKIFVDSNYFIALSNPADSLHARALRVAEKLELEKRLLVISSLIFLEIVTVVAQKRDRIAAVETGNYLLADSRIIHTHVDDSLQKDSWTIFQGIENKNMSFVDCSILAVLKSEGIDQLLTFDKKDFQPLCKRFHFSLYE